MQFLLHFVATYGTQLNSKWSENIKKTRQAFSRMKNALKEQSPSLEKKKKKKTYM